MGGTEVNGLMVFNSSGYTVLVHVNIAIFITIKVFFYTQKKQQGKLEKILQ